MPREAIEEVLGAAILAPSGKNRQPWKFLVYQGAAKAALLDEMEKGIARKPAKTRPLPGWPAALSMQGATLRTMRAAPVVILVLNTNAASPFEAGTPESRFMAMYDDLAVGAAIQNLLIRAAELGLGTLWIGNTGYAYEELTRFVGTEHRLVGAVALGWPDEAPRPAPQAAGGRDGMAGGVRGKASETAL